MITQLTKGYSGANLSGATSGVIYLPIFPACTLNGVDVKTDENVAGADVIFEVLKNGVVIPGLAALTIETGNKIGTVSGLNFALAKGDEIVLNLLSGSVSSPVTLNLTVDDGVSPSAAQDSEVVTTGSLNNTQIGNVSVALGKHALITKIVADRACWVRLYSTAQYRTNDAGRLITNDPTGEHGVLLDCLLEAGNLTLDLAPIISIFDGETVRTGSIAAAIQNLSGSTSTVQVTFTKLTLES